MRVILLPSCPQISDAVTVGTYGRTNPSLTALGGTKLGLLSGYQRTLINALPALSNDTLAVTVTLFFVSV